MFSHFHFLFAEFLLSTSLSRQVSLFDLSITFISYHWLCETSFSIRLFASFHKFLNFLPWFSFSFLLSRLVSTQLDSERFTFSFLLFSVSLFCLSVPSYRRSFSSSVLFNSFQLNSKLFILQTVQNSWFKVHSKSTVPRGSLPLVTADISKRSPDLGDTLTHTAVSTHMQSGGQRHASMKKINRRTAQIDSLAQIT